MGIRKPQKLALAQEIRRYGVSVIAVTSIVVFIDRNSSVKPQ